MLLVKSSIDVTFVYIKVSIFLAKNFLNGFFHRASLKLAVLAVEQNGNLEKKVKKKYQNKTGPKCFIHLYRINMFCFQEKCLTSS